VAGISWPWHLDQQHSDRGAVDPCWWLNNASSYDPQAHGSVVAFPLEYSPKVNQSMEQVDCYVQLSINVVDLKLFIKYV
jgi:hypothetical protein